MGDLAASHAAVDFREPSDVEATAATANPFAATARRVARRTDADLEAVSVPVLAWEALHRQVSLLRPYRCRLALAGALLREPAAVIPVHPAYMITIPAHQ